jgi:2,4-dienoyl-CoA reductase-like NADH-dependent reductase (Old Yellow Enzyme family)
MPKYFTYKNIEDLREEITNLDLSIRLETEIKALREPVKIGNFVAGNALGIHPMEGCDGTLDGKPDELTYRRWIRFGQGGCKMIWGEATAVIEEGRANSRQLLINDTNAKDLEDILNKTRQAHREEFGKHNDLVIGLQLTHSGRFSYKKPFIAFHHPILDKITLIDKKTKTPIPNDYPVVSDDYLEKLEDIYVEAARLAYNIGFDFIDIKQCHTYLLSELLAAKTREGKYGGSFENRTRFVRNIIGKIKNELGDKLMLATRINVYDGLPYQTDPETDVGVPRPYTIPYRYAFGVNEMDPLQVDLTEPMMLVKLLRDSGVKMVNISMGSPYFNPHIIRPFERPPIDGYESPEHPLIGVDRHFRATSAIQQAFPDLVIVGTGYTWLREYLLYAAEANVRDKKVSIAAVGRGAIAYPDYAKDGLTSGKLDPDKVCLTMSFCTALMRAKNNELGQFPTGCVPRDKVYVPIYGESKRGVKRDT